MRLKDDPFYHPKRKAVWYSKRRKHNLKRMRQWRRQLHFEAITKLGKRCCCCSEQRITMLEIDHVHGGGNDERRSDNRNNFKLYQRIRDGVVSLTPYQVLCSSCNHSKRRNGGFCEHYTEKWMHWTGMDSVIA